MADETGNVARRPDLARQDGGSKPDAQRSREPYFVLVVPLLLLIGGIAAIALAPKREPVNIGSWMASLFPDRKPPAPPAKPKAKPEAPRTPASGPARSPGSDATGSKSAPRAAAVAPTPSWRVPAPEQRLTRIAFGSCLDQRLSAQILATVLDTRPDLFLMLGDNVYGDVASAEMRELIHAYRVLGEAKLVRDLRGRVPVLATWDDHDYGANDADGRFAHKAASRRIFREFWGAAAGPDAGPGEGVYHAHTFGPPGERVQVILLDTRFFRSPFAERPRTDQLRDRAGGKYVPDQAAEKTLLGAAQWRWLESELRKPADLRVLVSSIQVLAESHGWERWGHLPRERQRLFDLLRTTGASNLVVVSGDRHRAAIYRRTDVGPQSLVEVTSSSLNRPFSAADPADPGRRQEMYGAENFGLIEVDWSARKARLSLRGLIGQVVDSIEVPLGAPTGPR